MRHLCYLGSLFILALQLGYGQDIANPAFDNKVSSTISYHIPVISVEKACNDSLGQLVFLDAREKEEYDVSHIAGALYIGYNDFDISSIIDLPKDKTIIVYCSIGYRSDIIGERLKKAGFPNVYNLYGSIFEWVNRGYTIVDPSGKPTNQLHTYNKKWSQWVDHPDVVKVW